MFGPVKSRLIHGLLFAIFIFGHGESLADHDRGTGQPIQDNSGALPDFDDLEPLPDLDDLGSLDDELPLERETPDQPASRDDNLELPGLPDFDEPGFLESVPVPKPELVLIIKGRVTKISQGKAQIKVLSGYFPKIGDKLDFTQPYAGNADFPGGSGVITEAGEEVWARITAGSPEKGMTVFITSINPGKNANFIPEKPPIPAVPDEPDPKQNPEDLYRAGLRFYTGEGGLQDYARAFKWMLLAAKKGHIRAQNDVGVMYELGQGAQRNPQQAVYWYKRSAVGNYAMGHYNLGRAYDSGMGAPKNFSEAIRSYRRSARLGEIKAQQRLRKQRLRW